MTLGIKYDIFVYYSPDPPLTGLAGGLPPAGPPAFFFSPLTTRAPRGGSEGLGARMLGPFILLTSYHAARNIQSSVDFPGNSSVPAGTPMHCWGKEAWISPHAEHQGQAPFCPGREAPARRTSHLL